MTSSTRKAVNRRSVLALSALAAGLWLAACGRAEAPAAPSAPAEAPAAQAERVVNVYSARHYDSDKALFDAFTAATGITVRVREGDAAQLLETLRQEGTGSPADVVIAADAGTMYRFQEAGLLQGVSDAGLEEAIPADLREPGGHWFGLSLRMRVIAVDPARVPDGAITGYADLADPRWKGEVCVRSSSNVYNLSLLADLIDRWGQEQAAAWAAGVRANFAREPQGGDTDQLKALAAGECSIALVNHYYWVRLSRSANEADRAVAAASRLIVPEQGEGQRGVHANVTGAGIAAGSPNRDNALVLLNYLAGPDGQAGLVVETGEITLAGAAEGTLLPFATQLAEGVAPRLRRESLSVFGANQSLARTLYEQAGWN
jgi:iron(III) transport system substrate-binding protein